MRQPACPAPSFGTRTPCSFKLITGLVVDFLSKVSAKQDYATGCNVLLSMRFLKFSFYPMDVLDASCQFFLTCGKLFQDVKVFPLKMAWIKLLSTWVMDMIPVGRAEGALGGTYDGCARAHVAPLGDARGGERAHVGPGCRVHLRKSRSVY